MKLLSLGLLLPTAVIGLVIAIAACGSSTPVDPPCICDGENVPAGPCEDKTYVTYGGAYLTCSNDVWSYTTTDPSADGYTRDSAEQASIDSEYPESSDTSDKESVGSTPDMSSGESSMSADDTESVGSTEEESSGEQQGGSDRGTSSSN